MRVGKVLVEPLSALLVIFFLSGTSSLIYQVVWQRVLTLYYGVGPVSTAIVISVYMLGLGLGGYAGGILADRRINPVRTYFLIEVLLCICGFASLPIINSVGQATAGADYRVTLVIVFVILTVPTFLMGLTLPILVKFANGLRSGFVRNVSMLYFVNTLGAAFGAIVSAYFLISWFGLDVATWTAAAINLALGLSIFALARSWKNTQQPTQKATITSESTGKSIYFWIFTAGFVALGLEIAWFRIIGFVAKSSSYVFATVLAVLLLGIALGSLGTNSLIRRGAISSPKSAYFSLQFGIGVYVLMSFAAFYWLRDTGFVHYVVNASFTLNLHPPQIDIYTIAAPDFFQTWDFIFWPLYFVFPPAVLMGAAFPLVSYLAYQDPDKDGSAVGSVYFITILGNVLGSLVTGFVLLPLIGTELTIALFALVSMAFIVGVSQLKLMLRIGVAAVPVFIIWFAGYPMPGDFYRAFIHSSSPEWERYFVEGQEGVVTTLFHTQSGAVRNYVGSLSHGGVMPGGIPECKYAYEAIEAASYAKNSRRVLVIGVGTGGTLHTLLANPEIEQIDLVELSGILIDNLRNVETIDTWLSDPRVTIHIEDGRRFLLQSENNYDVILMDALRGTTSYANNLYSAEFMKLISSHLSKGGTYMTLLPEGKIDARTLATVYPDVRRYRAFGIAANEKLELNSTRRSALIQRAAPECQAQLESGEGLGLRGDRDWVMETTKSWPTNHDLKPRGEYYLWNQWFYDW